MSAPAHPADESADLVAALSYAELRRWAKHFGVKGRRKAFKLRASLQPYAAQIAKARAGEGAKAETAAASKDVNSPGGSEDKVKEDSSHNAVGQQDPPGKVAGQFDIVAEPTDNTAKELDTAPSGTTAKTAKELDTAPSGTAAKTAKELDTAPSGTTAKTAKELDTAPSGTTAKTAKELDTAPSGTTAKTAKELDTAPKGVADEIAEAPETTAPRVLEETSVELDKTDQSSDKASSVAAAAAAASVASPYLTDDSVEPSGGGGGGGMSCSLDSSQKENVPPVGYPPDQQQVSQHSARSFFYVAADAGEDAIRDDAIMSDDASNERSESDAAAPAPARRAVAPAPNFAAIHARNAARTQESLADYQARRAARATYLLSQPVISRARLETQQVTSTPHGRAAVTQTSPQEPQQQQPQQPASAFASPTAAAAPRHQACRSAYTPGSGARHRPKFDLQSSLARPLTWVPHRGPLRPFAPESPAFGAGAGGSRKRFHSARDDVGRDVANSAKRERLDLE